MPTPVPACGATPDASYDQTSIAVKGDEEPVEGMCGVVQDGVLPGYFGYEAGRRGRDMLAWFVDHAVPPEATNAPGWPGRPSMGPQATPRIPSRRIRTSALDCGTATVRCSSTPT
jgi:hypothetical protein